MAARRRRLVRFLFLAACGCLFVVALTHVVEWLRIFPVMGWGLPDSPGHYLDPVSAVSGIAFLVSAGVVRLLRSD